MPTRDARERLAPASIEANQLPAIHDDRLPGHPRAGVRGEEERRSRDVLRLAEPTERIGASDLLPSSALPERSREVGTDETGGDRVHADARSELRSELLREMDERR